jgi:hypothetical protein
MLRDRGPHGIDSLLLSIAYFAPWGLIQLIAWVVEVYSTWKVKLRHYPLVAARAKKPDPPWETRSTVQPSWTLVRGLLLLPENELSFKFRLSIYSGVSREGVSPLLPLPVDRLRYATVPAMYPGNPYDTLGAVRAEELRIPSWWKLASARTVEYPPVGNVLAKVVETMLRSCGDEEEITSLE